MAETAFLTALAAHFSASGLTPTPKLIGAAEADGAGALPAVVLSLESSARAGNGLGERSTLITDGALAWPVSIDLANPVLAAEPTFRLLDPTRKLLVLPHGGLVRADGSEGPLGPADLTVKVGGVARTVVAAAPTAAQVSADPTIGQLTFGAALPATGAVDVRYFLGEWEQRVLRMSGVLRVDVCAGAAGDVDTIATAIVEDLLDAAAKVSIVRLLSISLLSLSSIGAPETPVVLRRRTARFAFVFEQQIDRPDSSGGIIGRIPINDGFLVSAGPS